MLQGTKNWLEGMVDARLVKAKAQATFALGSAVGQVTKAIVQAGNDVVEKQRQRIELIARGLHSTLDVLTAGQHEAEDRANERHHALVELLDRASTERAALLEKLQSVDTQIEVSVGKVLERQTRAGALDKHDRKERVKLQAAAPVTGLLGPGRRGADAPERTLGSNGSAPMPRPAAPDAPLVPVSNYPTADRERLVAAMRNGEVDGCVKRPGRAVPGGWCAPAASIDAWLSKHPTRDVVDA